jgi:predicted ATPase
MYLSLDIISSALETLKDIHPFYGTTFLACKRENLPVGRSIPFAIAEVETNFIKEYYQPVKTSNYLYTAFSTPKKDNRWLKLKKYASSTLQGTRTRQAFKDCFIHELDTSEWGWKADYLSVLKSCLSQNKRSFSGNPLPTFDLAAWLFRDVDWGSNPSQSDLVQKFLSEFNIASNERILFDIEDPQIFGDIFVSEKFTQQNLRKLIGSPRDAKLDSGGLLDLLEIRSVGPAREMKLHAAPRLNLFTGDNGLGKSFILETIWWALTGEWTEDNTVAQPDINTPHNKPEIKFQIASESSKSEPSSFRFDWRSSQWVGRRRRDTLAGLTIYARVDASYAIWDPTGTLATSQVSRELSEFIEDLPFRERLKFSERINAREQVVLENKEIFEGGENIEGLIRDWVKWQNRPDRYPFAELCKVLEILSPPDFVKLEPGAIQDSSRRRLEMPTIKHPYGDVPIIYVSAGIKRIIALAYLIVWAWNEHKNNSERLRIDPQRRMVILVDELEAHLHPQWQRTILPALISIGEILSSELKIQYLISTHSPLVMASAEPLFNDATDKQFHLDISEKGEVKFEEKDFVKYGLVDYWLVSPTFNMKQPLNKPAEIAIEKAKKIQLQDDPNVEEIKRISEELSGTLAQTDPFWVRWVLFAERYGIEL